MSYYDTPAKFEDLLGAVIVKIDGGVGDEVMDFHLADGRVLTMQHVSDCCESVNVQDIAGDLADLLNNTVLMAEAPTNMDEPADVKPYESYTWTFYRIGTVKGTVVIRWLGESNGYYGETPYIWWKS